MINTTYKNYFIIGLLFISLGLHAADEGFKRYTVTPVDPQEAENGKLTFRHGDTYVVLREDGTWGIEALVDHHRFLCSTYEVGVRFGEAYNGCINVAWLGDTEYVTSRKHCNNATRMHKGDSTIVMENEENDKIDLKRLSCAQISIRCSGRCD